jgi:type I restriction enzyme M protein
MWANAVDFYFLHKVPRTFGVTYEPMMSWPMADETIDSMSMLSAAKLRRGEEGMLKTAFRRCHNYIHGNEGMSKDAAFWQFLYLLFAKAHDDQVSQDNPTARRFYALPDEPYDEDKRKVIRRRILDLFTEVKREYPDFTARDEITLSDRALAFIVSELGPYDLNATEIDVKGIAYQELVGTNLRGDRGQYFTPRGAVQLMVDILDPQEHETVFDPACGTGGFLRETLRHMLINWQLAEGVEGKTESRHQLAVHRRRLRRYAEEHLFGADFDPSLVRATNLNVMLLTGAPGNIYHMDSLAFPHGHLSGVADAKYRIPLNSVDVLMTNPPFGTDIKIVDGDVLGQYRNGVAKSWSRDKETGLPIAADRDDAPAMAPEQLFIQRAVDWVKPGGRTGIVLPNGILSNPGPADEAIRRWILANCWVLASIELPVETFIAEAGVNILTTLLFLKKKTDEERMAHTLGERSDYPVFMAVAEKVGVDRRGNEVYEREANGDIILKVHSVREEHITIDGKTETRILRRKLPVIDNDLPKIGEAYHAFRRTHPEPGEPR